MSRDRGSPRGDNVGSSGAASPTTVQRHPFTRTPSTEPPRFHLPVGSSHLASTLHPGSGADGTLAVNFGSSPSVNVHQNPSVEASVHSLDSAADPYSASRGSSAPGSSSASRYWPEPSLSHAHPTQYGVNNHSDPDSYAMDQRPGPQYRTARLNSKSTGYTSSTDGDLTPIASTSRGSPTAAGTRVLTPLVGVNLTDQQIADMTESDVSEYDENTKLRRARRGSGANSSASSMFSSITKSLRGEPFWNKSAASYTPLSATRSRSLKKSKWNRSSKTDKMLLSNSSSATSKDRNRGRRSSSIWTHPLSMVASFFTKIFRTVFGPIHPVTIVLALVLIASFVASVTKLIIYILNPDKEPKPWRVFCQRQPSFPHAYADALAPVDVFVGVFSIDSAYERRHLIRSTYATHTLPVDPHTGTPTSNVQVKFIIGKPRRAHSRRVALEMETFNDLVVLDMDENMNRGKTHAFFRWAAENATVPFLHAVDSEGSPVGTSQTATPLGEQGVHGNSHGQTREVLGGSADKEQRYQVLWKKADYVVKADDDSYIVLEELERHLRVAPRQMTYWGYLIRNWFMGGECYGLSSDLVQYVAHSGEVLRHIKGKEDKKVAQWINLHPNRTDVHWVSERCWIYDHPKAGTAYSHGFLFPDYVEKIKLEGRRGLSDQEIARRGGEHRAKSYSTVSRWHAPYVEPRSDLTIEEEVEALVEGGGRWAGTWVRGEEGNDTQIWVPWQQIVFEANDERLKPPMLDDFGPHPTLAEEVGIDPASGLTVRHVYSSTHKAMDPLSANLDGDLPPSQRGKRDIPFLEHLPSVPGFDFGAGGVSSSAAERRKRSFANAAMQPRMIPLPTHKDGNGEADELRNRRYLGRRFGGTVVVHYLKKSEWFYETALALSGRGRFWPSGAGGTDSEWRMYGSPLVRHEDGFISGGRSQPRPDMDLAYLQQARIQAQANAAQAQALNARMGSFTKPKPSNAGPPASQSKQQQQQQQQQQPGSA